MSARSKFHSLLKAANFGDAVSGDIVAEILGDHAHELAERIRVGVPSYGGMKAAADLIDPEVE